MNIVVCSDGRCGSLWLTFAIAHKLKRSFGWLDEGLCENTVHMTHVFELIESFDGLVIHSTRRNALDHFIATVFYDRVMCKDEEWVNFSNSIGIWSHIHDDEKRKPILTKKFKEMVERTRIRVYRKEFEDFMQARNKNKQFINAYGGLKHTIYYEDLFDGITIPELSIGTISFEQKGIFAKLPYDKTDIVTNYKEIEEWFIN